MLQAVNSSVGVSHCAAQKVAQLQLYEKLLVSGVGAEWELSGSCCREVREVHKLSWCSMQKERVLCENTPISERLCIYCLVMHFV